jgi:sec-independent protein translocase protein TatA
VSISGIEWILIFVVALILFGPKKLPELGRAVGKSIREFKKATNGILSEDEEKKPEPVKLAQDHEKAGETKQQSENGAHLK